MRRLWWLGLLLGGFVAAVTRAQTVAPKPAPSPAEISRAALVAYGDGCAAHVGHAVEMNTWAQQNHFVPAPPRVVALFAARAASTAWIVPGPGVSLALVAQQDGLLCHVYAQHADVDLARALFVKLMEGVRRPGLLVEQKQDAEVVRGDRRVRVVAYMVQREQHQPGEAARAFAITLNAAPDAAFAIIATAGAVKAQ
jgi:hypothetical protein